MGVVENILTNPNHFIRDRSKIVVYGVSFSIHHPPGKFFIAHPYSLKCFHLYYFITTLHYSNKFNLNPELCHIMQYEVTQLQ